VNTAQAADNHPIFYSHVASERGAVSYNAPICHSTIVPYMGVGHKEILVTYRREHTASACPRLKSDILSDDVATPNAELARLTAILKILRRRSHRCKLINSILISESGMSIKNHMRTNPIVSAEAYMRADDRVRPH
jgi:hypothetical protein